MLLQQRSLKTVFCTLAALQFVVAYSRTVNSNRKSSIPHVEDSSVVRSPCDTYMLTASRAACERCLQAEPQFRQKLCDLTGDTWSQFCNFDKCYFDKCCTPSDVFQERPDGCPLCFETTKP